MLALLICIYNCTDKYYHFWAVVVAQAVELWNSVGAGRVRILGRIWSLKVLLLGI